jgi:hypothetical protein
VSIPAGVETVTVTDGGIALTGPDGTPLEGSFTVAGPDLATVAEDDFLFGGLARRWVSAGRFDSLSLVATDATGIDPTGFSYTIVFTPRYGAAWTRYFQLPKASPSVVLADILIPDPVAGSHAVLADTSPASTVVPETSYGQASEVGNASAYAREDHTHGTPALPSPAAIGADPSGTASSVVTAHTSATDPHGDRAWADSKFATTTDLGTLNTTVTNLDGFVQDCLTRVSAIENGTAWLSGLNVAGNALVSNGDLTVSDTSKGYRFRRGGSALDLEATGADLILSNWSGTAFNGTQRSYDRYSADALNVQHAGKREYVDGLYGTAVHTLDPATGVAALGAKNGLANVRLVGFKNSPGAPVAGDWAAGDVVLDAAGAWHLCTAGGTPGTWT